MGQVALGFRSLLIKAAIFFVLAALLAWVLGGSLFPRDTGIGGDQIVFQGHSWHWRWRSESDALVWDFVRMGDEDPIPVEGGPWAEAGPMLLRDDALLFAGRSPESGWLIGWLDADLDVRWYEMPDRLAVERQIERVKHGLEIQDLDTIRAERDLVLAP